MAEWPPRQLGDFCLVKSRRGKTFKERAGKERSRMNFTTTAHHWTNSDFAVSRRLAQHASSEAKVAAATAALVSQGRIPGKRLFRSTAIDFPIHDPTTPTFIVPSFHSIVPQHSTKFKKHHFYA